MSPMCKNNECKKPPPCAPKEPDYLDLAYRISVMQAALAGKGIESCFNGEKVFTRSPNPAWNWTRYNYRVEREPFTAQVLVNRDTGRTLGIMGSEDIKHYIRGGWELITLVEKG